MKTVTAILTIYKRVDYLEKQIKALKESTHPVTDWIFCVNNVEEKARYEEIIKRLVPDALIVEFSRNLGVWNRFYLGYNAKTEYVFVLDDDIIVGKERIGNCVKQNYGIIGSWGSLFNSLETRSDRDIICESEGGNVYRPNKLTEVDMTGHSWFFRREYLPAMFIKFPDVDYPTCGEELWVSYMARFNGIPTYIIPMTEDIETWGNKEPRLGLDMNANFRTEAPKYQEFYDYCVKDGFIPLRIKKGKR